MANKRMFSLDVVETDLFLDLPVSTQALYFHLGMYGDDDGFVGSPKRTLRTVGCNEDDLKLLIAKGFIIPFDSGVVVIRDWKINNSLKNDRYKKTIYQNEKSMLSEDVAGRYLLGTALDPNLIQSGSKTEPQPNTTQNNLIEKSFSLAGEYGQYGWVKLTDSQYASLLKDLGGEELDRCIQYVDESAQSTENKNGWKDWDLIIRRCSRDKWGTPDTLKKEELRPDFSWRTGHTRERGKW